MNNWEISVWDDRYDSTNNYYEEIKLAVIGSNTMKSEFRAREPKMVSNVNGTHKFSFKIFYDYIDTITGELKKNPFAQYLFNERKIKVFWKNEWYDFIIKNSSEDSSAHTITFDCEDLFITELSRTGFGLTFDDELQNNIDTAPELVKRVINGTTWQFDEVNSDPIYQKTEEAVWEVTASSNFNAVKTPSNNSISIVSGSKLLIYYSCCQDLNTQTDYVQFVMIPSNDEWITNENDMLVTNGTPCAIDDVIWVVSGNTIIAKKNNLSLFTINISTGISARYRAERYVRQQKSIFNPIVNRYVNIYEDASQNKIYGYESTEFYEPQTTVNLIANPNNYKNVLGWKTSGNDGLQWNLYPPFNSTTVMKDYNPISYLKLPKYAYSLNTGLQSNKSFLREGFQKNETYVFRAKIYNDVYSQITSTIADIYPVVCGITNNGIDPNLEDIYFTRTWIGYQNGWSEWEMTCTKSCPSSWLLNLSGANSIGLFLYCGNSNDRYVSNVQFFKEIYNDNNERLEPDKLTTTSVVKEVYKFFDPNTTAKTLDELPIQVYTKSNIPYIPIYNNFEKMAHIEASQSNRFNILQSIAESFKCWIKFKIEHNENGQIARENGQLKKYILLKEETGAETGINFIYGIDLKAIKRKIVSDKIATKTIVQANENEFGKNGFCTIARSTQNYPRETFIYNFDYFINKGMLNKDQLNNDLYNANTGLYHILNNNNIGYMVDIERIVFLKAELTKLQATKKIYDQYFSSVVQGIENTENDLIKLANANTIEEALEYAKNNSNNTKVVTLVNNRSQLKRTQTNYSTLQSEVNTAISDTQELIDSINELQEIRLENVQTAITNFEKKYVRYIQEGTWQSEDYYDDNLYYIDAQQVAYTSSRPQVTYDISIMRVSDLDDFKSKIFRLGDICSIEDHGFFGYLIDENGIKTPYKEKIIISEITSYFETPEKDIIKVQNYKTQFDDLFQRIAAATQTLEFSEGKYSKVADIINTDGTIKSAIIQNTFNENINLIQSSVNNTVIKDNTGITISDTTNSAQKVKVTAGGLFVSGDGGITWNNAIRGDGITADVITTGKLNTENITIYNENSPSFSWDKRGINAYLIENGQTNLGTFVRFDKYGVYGIKGVTGEWIPASEEAIELSENSIFGLTWNKFFLKGNSNNEKLSINSNGITIQTKNNGAFIDRIKLGQLTENTYGVVLNDKNGKTLLSSDDNGAEIFGWDFNVNNVSGEDIYILSSGNLQLRSSGDIGCYAANSIAINEPSYQITLSGQLSVTNVETGAAATLSSGTTVFVFSDGLGNRIQVGKDPNAHNSNLDNHPELFISSGERSIIPLTGPQSPTTIYLFYNNKTYTANNINWTHTAADGFYKETVTAYDAEGNPTSYITEYTFKYRSAIKQGNTSFGTITTNAETINKSRTYPPKTEKWKISGDGSATFYDIKAQSGEIAGWFIDQNKIYRTANGQRNGTVVAQLNSKKQAYSGQQSFDMVAEAINAAAALIGGVSMANGMIDGYSISDLLKQIKDVQNTAWSAYNLAKNTTNSFNSHKHRLTVTSDRLPVYGDYTGYFNRVVGSETGGII